MAETRVAIDVTELENEAILTALLDAKGEVFRTARGRKAVLIGNAALLRLRTSLSLSLEDGQDGSQILRG